MKLFCWFPFLPKIYKRFRYLGFSFWWKHRKSFKNSRKIWFWFSKPQ